jgi:hypothetical protein
MRSGGRAFLNFDLTPFAFTFTSTKAKPGQKSPTIEGFGAAPVWHKKCIHFRLATSSKEQLFQPTTYP